MATKLGLFNGALRELGHRPLSDTGEPVKVARDLAGVYDQVVAECISMGQWNFAIETVKLTADTGVEPAFGYSEVFAKPTDWVRTVAVSEDEYFDYPHMRYNDDVDYWSADNTPVYVRYVSDDTGLGLELSRWPAKFTRYVELELAARVCGSITQSTRLEEKTIAKAGEALRTAKNHDAMNDVQPRFSAPGAWSQSRTRSNVRRDRGSRNSLTG